MTPHIGYLHRCAEKIGENLTPRQFLPYTDRLDYLAAISMNLGWALCVEKLLGLKVSEKTRHLRVIMVELSRIASHLVAAGSYGLDLGSFTPFTWTFREREKILNLFEEVCGARLTYSYIMPGGVTADLPPGWLEKCEAFLDQFKPVIDELHALLTNNAIFIHRMAGVGVLPAAMAIDYGCTGPGAARQRGRLGSSPRRRAALHRDVRRLHVAGDRRDRRPLSPGPSLSARPARGRAGRFVASLLRADARGGAVDGLDPPGDG